MILTSVPVAASQFPRLTLPPSLVPISGSVPGAPRLRPLSACQRSLMRHHGIWHSAYGVCAWSRTAGPGGAGAGSVDGGIPRCGYFVLARDTGDFRVARVLNAGRAMDCFGVPLLDQYLMREMMPVLVLAIGLCATLGMSLGALAGLVREVAISGLPLRVAGAAAMLQLPYFAAASMPMACLAASLFGLGRLQSDMESVALFAVGVPLWRMFLTPLCLCFVVTILKLACHNYLVPYELERWLRRL